MAIRLPAVLPAPQLHIVKAGGYALVELTGQREGCGLGGAGRKDRDERDEPVETAKSDKRGAAGECDVIEVR